jgi:hypothetical protein
MTGEFDDVLAGAAAGLDRIAGFPGKMAPEQAKDRLMIAVKGRRIEPPVRFATAATFAKFNDIIGQSRLLYAPLQPALNICQPMVFTLLNDYI